MKVTNELHMKTSNLIKVIGILCIIFGVSGISQSIFSIFLPKVIEIGNWPEQNSDLIGWGVKLGYLGILVYVFYLTTGILYLLKKPFSLVMMYFALSISILFKIVPLLFLNQYSSTTFIINFGFNISNLFGPVLDISLLIGLYIISKNYYQAPEVLKELYVEDKKIKTLPQDLATYKNSITSKIVFLLSIVVFGFWILTNVIDVYHFDSVGAIFEFLWLFMLLGLLVLPIVSIVFLVKKKFSFRSFYLYSILISVTNILLMIFGKR